MDYQWKYEFLREDQIVKGYGIAQNEKELIDKIKSEDNLKRKPKNFAVYKIGICKLREMRDNDS